MTRKILIPIFIYFIIASLFETSAFASDEVSEKYVETVLGNLVHISKKFEDVLKLQNHSMNAVLHSMYKTADDEEFRSLMTTFQKENKIINDNYKSTQDAVELGSASSSWYKKLFGDQILSKQTTLLKKIRPMILPRITRNFDRDFRQLDKNVKDKKVRLRCEDYHAIKIKYHYLIENLILADMKVLMTSFLLWTHIPSAKKMSDIKQLMVYGPKSHLERVREYTEKAVNLGKGVEGEFKRCEYTLIPPKSSKLFHEIHVMYKEDWLGIGRKSKPPSYSTSHTEL